MSAQPTNALLAADLWPYRSARALGQAGREGKGMIGRTPVGTNGSKGSLEAPDCKCAHHGPCPGLGRPW